MTKEPENFLDAMHDVKPLKAAKRVSLETKKSGAGADNTTLEERRQAAVAETVADADPLANSEVEQLEATAILSYQRPGVQHGVYRQLRLGKYSIEARLDLHRMRVEQARMSVYQFIRDCLENDIRCALITHGKGEGREKPAVLKSYLAHWLPQIDHVLAFHSAQKHHGGSGATYILIKKSDRKRQENLELHQRR